MNHKRFFRLNILIFGYPNLKDELWVIESFTGGLLSSCEHVAVHAPGIHCNMHTSRDV